MHISGRNLERPILKSPLSGLCAVALALQNRAPFEGGREGREHAERKSERGVASKGQRKKRTRENFGGGEGIRCHGPRHDCVNNLQGKKIMQL